MEKNYKEVLEKELQDWPFRKNEWDNLKEITLEEIKQRKKDLILTKAFLEDVSYNTLTLYEFFENAVDSERSDKNNICFEILDKEYIINLENKKLFVYHEREFIDLDENLIEKINKEWKNY